jgi:precorrin-8X/cobalt-precorrin-8 methylmutase
VTQPRRPNRHYEYVDDGPAIYVDSFATIRREARLGHLPANAERLAVRMIHGTGAGERGAGPGVGTGVG